MAGTFHPKEVIMRNSKTTLLALALVAIAVAAWAGNSAAADKPKSDKDNQTVAQVQPVNEDKKPDQATQAKPKADQAPESRDKGVQPAEHSSDNAQPPKSEPNRVRAPEPRSNEIQTPTSSQPREPRVVTEPAPIIRSESKGGGGSGSSGGINAPQRGGEPNRGRQDGGGSYRGYGGGRGRGGHRGHDYSGRTWHGPREQWRYRNYHGSWSFLFGYGPVIYYPPMRYPYIIRLPHERVGVYVRQTGDDYVGTQFAEAVRQQLRDEGIRVVYSQSDAQLELYMISMEQNPEDAGYGSSISISYVWYPGHKFITAQMVDAGLNEVDELAQSVVSYTDDLIDQYR
jgi:hypothetical protein